MSKAQPSQKPTVQLNTNPIVQQFAKDLETMVEKRSSSNMFWNKRSFTIKKGILSYYSKLYQAGSNFDNILPKSSLAVVNIISIEKLDEKKEKKQNVIRISFYAKDRIIPDKKKWIQQKQEMQQSIEQLNFTNSAVSSLCDITKDKNKNKIQNWDIAFADPAESIKFLQTLEETKNPKPNQQTEIQDKIQQIKQKEDKEAEFQRQRQLSQQQKEAETQRKKQEEDFQRQRQLSKQEKEAKEAENDRQRQKEAEIQRQRELSEQERQRQLSLQQKQSEFQRQRELSQQQKDAVIEVIERQRILSQQKREDEIERLKQQETQNEIERAQQEQELKRQYEEDQQKIIKQRMIEAEELQKQKHQSTDMQAANLDYEWNYKFLCSLELSSDSNSEGDQQVIQSSLDIHKVLAQMKNHATDVCKIIIDELVLPNSMKTIRPVNTDRDQLQLKDQSLFNEDDIYEIDGLIVKLALTQIKLISDDQRLQVYDETAIKALGTEFRTLSLLANIIDQKIADNPTFPLRVPLAVIIDYKGVRALALAQTYDSGLALGPNEIQNSYQQNDTITEHLNQIGEELNLSPHQFIYGLHTISVPLSLFVEAHSIDTDQYLHLQQNQQIYSLKNLNIYHLKKTTELMPLYINSDGIVDVLNFHYLYINILYVLNIHKLYLN